MTDLDPSHEACPACESTSLSYWDDIGSWLCDECSYVLNATSSAPDVEENRGFLQTNTEDPENWQEDISIKDKSEENLVDVLSQTEELASEMSISNDVLLRASELVTAAWESNFMLGRTKEETVAAVMYAATREANCPIPAGSLAECVDSDKQSVKDLYLKLKQELELDIDPALPKDYIDYICASLSLSEEIKRDAKKRLAESNATGGNPIGIAAAYVYQTANEQSNGPTLREVARTATLTKETVWRHSKTINRD